MCLVICDAAAAAPRMHQGSEGFFPPVLVIGSYKEKKKKKDLEYEEDEGGQTAIPSLIFSPLLLRKQTQ